MDDLIRRVANLAKDLLARVVLEVKPRTVSPKEEEKADGVFFWGLERLARERTVYNIDLEHLNSKRTFYMALAQATPYALVSTVVAFMWALVTNRDLAVYPLAVALGISALFLLCRKEIGWLNQLIAVNRIDINRINERFEVRENQTRSGFLECKSKLSDYFSSYYCISFDREAGTRMEKVLATWIAPPDIQKTRDMEYAHPGLFNAMNDLVKKSGLYFKEIAKFRARVIALISQKGLKSAQPEANSEFWATEVARGLMIIINSGFRSISDINEAEASKILDKSQAEGLRSVFRQYCDAMLGDPNLNQLAQSSEKLRIEAKTLRDDIVQTIEMLYGTGVG